MKKPKTRETKVDRACSNPQEKNATASWRFKPIGSIPFPNLKSHGSHAK
ncbi:hypothetical protein QUB68_03150 [Microcoleus sp. A006_D1]